MKHYLLILIYLLCIRSSVFGEMIATHQTNSQIYANQTRITIETDIQYSYTDISAMAFQVQLPELWEFKSVTGNVESKPTSGDTGMLTFYWTGDPGGVHLEYNLLIHENGNDINELYALVKYRRRTGKQLYADVLPYPLLLTSAGHFIIATAGLGGEIAPEGSVLVADCQPKTFTIHTQTGYTINTLLVDNQPVSIENPYVFETVDKDHSIAVTFKKKQYPIIVETSTGGSVLPPGELKADYDTIQKFTVIPDVSYTISNIQVNGHPVSFTTNVFDVHVISATEIQIQFQKLLLVAYHSCDSETYQANSPSVFYANIENPDNLEITALGMRVTMPVNWSFVSADHSIFDISENILEFSWTSGMTDNIDFSYTLRPHVHAAGPKTIEAEIVYRVADGPEEILEIQPDIYLTQEEIANHTTITGTIYLDDEPAPYTSAVSLYLFFNNDPDKMLDIVSDGPSYIFSFNDPFAETYTILAELDGYADVSYPLTDLPATNDIYLKTLTEIEPIEIDEPDSKSTLVYESTLPIVQIGDQYLISNETLNAQNSAAMALIDIEIGSLIQDSSIPATISYTLREGLYQDESPYLARSNGNVLEIQLSNAQINSEKGIRLTIPVQAGLALDDFRGGPQCAVYYAPDKSSLVDNANISAIPEADIVSVDDQGVTFMARSPAIFSVGDIVEDAPDPNPDPQTDSSEDAGGGCFISSLD